ncbi:MAG: ABC transporter permease, partial [Planctomycetes bacterium]|nr:ABC transporter permease [Planctomycetota bacterium]
MKQVTNVRRIDYLRRSLGFHWRSHVATGLGVVVATATLTGALLVGDSMRGSLLDRAVEPLGRIDYALHGHRFVTQSLVEAVNEDEAFQVKFTAAVPAIIVAGGASNPQSGARSDRITILGTDDRFWSLANREALAAQRMPKGRAVVLNQPLADQLGVQVGDDVVLRMGKSDAVSTETLLGRRDDTQATLRLKVAQVIPAEGLGAFSLTPRQGRSHNVWVPLQILQRTLKQRDRVNTILVSSGPEGDDEAGEVASWVEKRIKAHLAPNDIGLRIRQDVERGYLSLESDSMMLPPSVEQAALHAAAKVGGTASSMLTYLANEIAIDKEQDGSRNARLIPYSTITAIDTTLVGKASLTCVGNLLCPVPALGEILLNEWAAERLGAAVGDRISVSYYVTGAFGELETRRHKFDLRAVVLMNDLAADPGFTPEFEGVTDTRNLADWDPPFPMNLDLVQDEDEEYWDRYKASPKAFISLADGQQLWTQGHERFGVAILAAGADAAGRSRSAPGQNRPSRSCASH